MAVRLASACSAPKPAVYAVPMGKPRTAFALGRATVHTNPSLASHGPGVWAGVWDRPLLDSEFFCRGIADGVSVIFGYSFRLPCATLEGGRGDSTAAPAAEASTSAVF